MISLNIYECHISYFFYKNSKPSYFSSPTFKNGGSKYISPFKSNKHILLRVVKLTSLTFNAKYKSFVPGTLRNAEKPYSGSLSRASLKDPR